MKRTCVRCARVFIVMHGRQTRCLYCRNRYTTTLSPTSIYERARAELMKLRKQKRDAGYPTESLHLDREYID